MSEPGVGWHACLQLGNKTVAFQCPNTGRWMGRRSGVTILYLHRLSWRASDLLVRFSSTKQRFRWPPIHKLAIRPRMRWFGSSVRAGRDDSADRQLFGRNSGNSLPSSNRRDHPEAPELENIADASLSRSGNIESFVRFLWSCVYSGRCVVSWSKLLRVEKHRQWERLSFG